MTFSFSRDTVSNDATVAKITAIDNSNSKITISTFKSGDVQIKIHADEDKYGSSGDVTMTIKVVSAAVEEPITKPATAAAVTAITGAALGDVLGTTTIGGITVVVVDKNKIGGSSATLIAAEGTTFDRASAVAVPVFTMPAPGAGELAWTSFDVTLTGSRREDMVPLKVKADKTVVKWNPRTSVGGGHGSVAEIAFTGTPATAKDGDWFISTAGKLYLAIEDNGAKGYDLDTRSGFILDPMVFAYPTSGGGTGNNPGSPSSSGCNAGFASLALLFVAPLFFFRKKK